MANRNTRRRHRSTRKAAGQTPRLLGFSIRCEVCDGVSRQAEWQANHGHCPICRPGHLKRHRSKEVAHG